MNEEIFVEIPTEEFITEMGKIIVKKPLWDDYAEIMENIPADKMDEKMTDDQSKKIMMKFFQEYILLNWILFPLDIPEKRKDPDWAASLFGVTMKLAIPLMEAFDIKKKPDK